MLKAILWDFDGTICDTYPAIARAVNIALARFGATASLDHVIELASISLDSCIRTLAQEHRIPYEALNAVFTEAYRDVQPTDQPPFPGFIDLCEQLTHVGVSNFIITHRRRQSLLVLLTVHRLLPYFTSIVAADDGFARKPAPDALLYILETYAIAPTDALIVGDRDMDILAGQAAGIATCLFRASFADIQPTYAILSYSELMSLLPSLREPV